ncbi:MAG: hypothetical protein ACPGJV_08530 [Bacteriovoracaceae bacterium]
MKRDIVYRSKDLSESLNLDDCMVIESEADIQDDAFLSLFRIQFHVLKNDFIEFEKKISSEAMRDLFFQVLLYNEDNSLSSEYVHHPKGLGTTQEKFLRSFFLDQSVATLIHEANNHLAGIAGRSYLVQRKIKKDTLGEGELQETFELVDSKVTELINAIKNLTSHTSFSLSEPTYTLEELVETLNSDYRKIFQKNGVELIVDEKSHSFSADSVVKFSLLMTLFKVFEFFDESQPTKLSLTSEDGQTLKLTVHDKKLSLLAPSKEPYLRQDVWIDGQRLLEAQKTHLSIDESEFGTSFHYSFNSLT